MYGIVFAISFLATTVGAICGIGGGVVIKPVMDASGLFPVDTINFLSGCTVLSMAAYSVARSRISGEDPADMRLALPLAVGAAAGGWCGRSAFALVQGLFPDPDAAAAVQAVALLAITVGTLAYTLCRGRIRSLHVANPAAIGALGLALGFLSSFLGIGGGPVNLVVLFYFFSMDIKVAAQCSLLVILFSQVTSTVTALHTQDLSDVDPVALAGMVVAGIAGGIVGRRVNARLDSTTVDGLFVAIMAIIICITIYNFQKYALL